MTQAANNEYVLEMINIDKRFQGVHALKSCSLNLKPGEVLALVGENGAGKSTIMKVLTGIHKPDSGDIYYFGQKVNFKSPREAQDAGLSIVHQELNLMGHLTVAQNIFIGRESNSFFLDEKGITRKTQELFKRMNISTIDPRSKVSDLTVGKQQIIEIAKAISFDAKIIIFDEPTATLTDTETEVLFKLINELRDNSVSMVYISHRMDEIKQISNRITVIRDGEYVGTRDTENVEIDEIIQMMIGRVTYEQPKESSHVPPDAPVVLKVEGLSSKDVDNISFELRKGEILGFAGLMGAGRTEVARLIFGADKKDSGNIYINGKKVSISSPGDAVRNGIGYLSEDRKRYGCVLGMRIADNIVLATLSNYVRGIFLNERKITGDSMEYKEKIDIRTPSVNQLLKNLSGGNQQKAIIAKWLIRDCDILIFDEPTRGIDVGAKSEIYKLMNTLANEGKSIIMISSELSEIFRMSDRILVMSSGSQTATLPIEEANQHTVMKHAVQYSHVVSVTEPPPS